MHGFWSYCSFYAHSVKGMEEEEEEGGASESSTSLKSKKEEGEGMAGERKEGTAGTGRNLQLEIDNILEETARKKNLSVMNVKSILRVSVVVKKL